VVIAQNLINFGLFFNPLLAGFICVVLSVFFAAVESAMCRPIGLQYVLILLCIFVLFFSLPSILFAEPSAPAWGSVDLLLYVG